MVLDEYKITSYIRKVCYNQLQLCVLFDNAEIILFDMGSLKNGKTIENNLRIAKCKT